MKILHVGTPFTDFTGKFGLTFRSSKGLIDLGHEVTVVTTDGDCFFFDKEKSHQYSETRKKLQNAEKTPIIYDGVPLYALHCTIPKFGMYCSNASKFARNIIPEFDIVHICSWYSHVGMSFAKIAKELDIPFIISSWGSLLPKARTLKGTQKWLADQIYTKKILLDAASFHSVGESETKEFLRMGVKLDNIYRMDNPVVIEDFKIKTRSKILEKNNLEKKNFLLFLGRINEKKGIELLLEAFQQIHIENKEIILAIVGSGTKEYENKMKKMVKDMELEKYVIFTGLISEEEKLEILEAAKMFILTSHSDVHPIAVQDALAMGIPVVITKACDYPEVMEFNAGIIINPILEEVVSAIKKLLKNKEELSKMSTNAIKLIIERFSLEQQVNKYEQMYKQTLQKRISTIKN